MRPRRLIPLFTALAALLLQLLAAMARAPGMHEKEELYNAAHAWILRSTGPDLALPLQYQPFCGGCAADALLGTGFFSLLGPSILAWRLVGLFWFALALAACTLVAWRAAGRAGATCCALFFALAPPCYQELALVSNGNHPEGGALLAAQLALAALALGVRRPALRELLLLLQALLAGFGLYFLRSLVLGPPLLLLTLLLARGGLRLWGLRALLLPAALLAGAAPLYRIRLLTGAWPIEPIYQAEEWRLSLDWTLRNVSSLLHPLQLRGIWGDVGGPSWLGLPAFAGWLLLAAGCALALKREGPTKDGLRDRRSALLALAAPALFLLLYCSFRLGVWMDGSSVPFPQQLRYLGVVAPAALLLGGVGAGALWRRRGWWRAAGLLALALLLLPGGLSRARFLSEAAWSLPQRRLAPDWCFQLERLRGDRELLERISRATPLPLVPFTAGLLAGDPSYVVTAGDRTAGAAFKQIPLPAEGAARHAWQRGQAAGVVALQREQSGQRFGPWLEGVAQGLPLQASTPAALRESCWCHGRGLLFASGGLQGELALDGLDALPPAEAETVGALLALGRGALASRICQAPGVPQSAEDMSLAWGPDCEVWHEELPAEHAGWGLGAALAELHGGRLRRLSIRVTQSDEAAFQRGFEQGWRFASSLAWLPERQPRLKLDWGL